MTGARGTTSEGTSISHPALTNTALLTQGQKRKSAVQGIDVDYAGAHRAAVDTVATIGEWRTFLAGGGYAERSQRMYTRSVMRFFIETNVPLWDLTETDVASWLEQWPHRSASRRAHYNGLLSFFSWCVRNGVLQRNPISGIKVAAPIEKVPRALTEAQYEAVKTAAYAHHPIRGYTVELLYYSGGRITEVLALTWEDITDKGVVFRHTKNGKERLVPWTEGLRHAVYGLKNWHGEQPRVLPKSQQTVWLWLRKAGNDAGVPDVHPHLFRSTAATRMLQRGARPHAVKDVLGHSKIQTTTRYWAVEDEDKEQAVATL